jgi:hypothetical protein
MSAERREAYENLKSCLMSAERREAYEKILPVIKRNGFRQRIEPLLLAAGGPQRGFLRLNGIIKFK